VNIYRQLAASEPEAFLPELAISLGNQACCLSELGRHTEALANLEEAIHHLMPFFLAEPRSFAEPTRHLFGQYLLTWEDGFRNGSDR